MCAERRSTSIESGIESGIRELVEIMRRLRDPETGCPWDQRQDFRSIAPYTIEEAYEVADAIERGDMVDLRDELGDLLLQVIYHAHMAEEQSAFDLGDVITSINTKMIRRHPHVFGENAGVMNEAEVKAAWEQIKRAERALKATEPDERDAASTPGSSRASNAGLAAEFGESVPASALDGIARNLPALVRAEKLQKRARGVGFDWPDAAPVWDCLQGEIAELTEAVRNRQEARSAAADAAVMEELGDVLFTAVNLARHLGVDAEEALRRSNARFERRFRTVEVLARGDDVEMNDASLEVLDALWQRAKSLDRESDESR
ncbi:MAG: nucleoside triphosphate pyrophosphohydrolase [Gammaproteobacteria bacterium]|nr:MAG: nucleoside triphosphate pyrophosphohydrolase [Gammaproteobacteria bacterium]